ncbi:UDP-N-acetylmuramoylalanyl-D-glutamate--2,6-diaminopimelate ligase [Bacillus paranthracis]|uniref:UDP-N-acetylmuramoylalanyl-D-glutamate--2, 6-diaminopimelate ligase n=1 Tax=Bacillus cereus group TaxID=86661 RepID=UPI002DBE659F|nr:UDP-N-acetylmuramoylalanyl-D-glutamate--2,6-diaminopimelate ligase [Bacillus anthracis]MEB9507284.1 UDP-N-acetylmuramoylalanyl-D-glutamate--2,6-diaminopimelate ligase [Bacillus anthracis]HDR7242746.1 UDP-N-acetylmuramoylalanyl-D-glutamate--2,6-diaminopimelate ligase [Bacillus mobilis]
MWIKKMLFNYRVKPSLLKSRYEIEKENRQVDLFESSTEMSKSVSIRDTRSYIQQDLAEVQMEFIQPNTKTLDDMFNYLAAIRETPSLSVDNNKMLWPLISKW